MGDEPALCRDGWGWPALLLALPTVVSVAGAVVSLVRRSIDAAVLGLIAAPMVALVAWAVAWSI